MFVYGPPSVHWVQTMRHQFSNTKTAGFDRKGAYLNKRLDRKQLNATVTE